MSVVSFNSTIPRVQSFSNSYYGFRFTNAYNYNYSVLFSSAHPSTYINDVEPLLHVINKVVWCVVIVVCCDKLFLLHGQYCWLHLTLQQSSIPRPDTGRKPRFLPQLWGPRAWSKRTSTSQSRWRSRPKMSNSCWTDSSSTWSTMYQSSLYWILYIIVKKRRSTVDTMSLVGCA